jgi:adenine-specific DNA methylase
MTPDTKGQPEQAEANRPHDTGPSTPPGERKQTRKKPIKHKANQSIAKTGGQTKHDNEKKRIKEYECTCPVCGQTHKYKTDQDLFMRRENRSKSTNVPVQFAGMHVACTQKRSRP